jgi:hypothetical protein
VESASREVVAEGKNFGVNSDNQGCLDESIARYKSTERHLNAISTNLFMQSCLESSRPTPGFCDKVPVGDMMKLVEWRQTQCRHYDLGDDLSCNHYLFIGRADVLWRAEAQRKLAGRRPTIFTSRKKGNHFAKFRVHPQPVNLGGLAHATLAKNLLIVALVVVVLVLGVVGTGVVWWMKNKDALMARAKEVVAEGKEFGGRNDQQACVDETIRRYKKEPGFGSAMSNNFFLRGCLDASKPTDGFLRQRAQGD